MELRGRIADAIEIYEQEVRQHIKEGRAHKELLNLVQLPRVTSDDLATASRSSGNDVLHAAVLAKDTKLITAAVQCGVDPFVRDLNGRTSDSMTQDASVHALLRQLANAEADQHLGKRQRPTYRGFLGKWTNMVGGYKMRWFVLKDGILSYYQSPEDEERHARGSIHMKHAKLLPDQRDKIRFQLVSPTGSGVSKMYLKGSDATESVRWLQMLEKAKRYEESGSADPTADTAPTSSMANAKVAGASSHTSATSVLSSRSPQPVAGLAPVAGQSSTSLSIPSTEERRPSGVSLPPNHDSDEDDDDLPDDHSIASVEVHEQGLPHGKNFSIVANLIETHFDLALSIADKLAQTRSQGSHAATTLSAAQPPVSAAGLASGVSQMSLHPNANQAAGKDEWLSLLETLRTSVTDRLRLWQEFNGMVHDREKYLKDQIDRELTTRRLWEEQMTQLGQQHNELEGRLREALDEVSTQRKAIRQLHGEATYEAVKNESKSIAGGLTGAVGGAAAMVGSVASSLLGKTTRSSTFDEMDDEFFDAVDSNNLPNLYVEKPLAQRRMSSNVAKNTGESAAVSQQDRGHSDDSAGAGAGAAAGAAGGAAAGAATGGGAAAESKSTEAQSTRSENQAEDTAPNSEKKQEESGADSDYPFNEPGFEPYEHLRRELPIKKDERPSMSLWSILKKNIGKDLTKIAFPVAFNEPTSMLQRMAEDMEFQDCLDAAALQSDSTRRIAYVAAFAASNYSSTIGRIAKPFNPLLGETFEYARPDLHYRYISEQVSHHPPISACYAESPSWEYMGCVDAKSKFMGRKFEIRPTGVAHAQIKIPSNWAPSGKRDSLPRARNDSNLVMEHFSWNKVTSCVSGFLVGSPIMEHYGDMTVTNHVTGDKCVLSFIPSGWTGADAREIRGKVTDAQGNVKWEIAGRWSTQLVARQVGQNSKQLSPDSQVQNGSNPISSAKTNDTTLLLWRNSEKSPAPFNLTPFAITLNSCPDDLRPWLPPTDCRLRPDLHAFENGKFDQADELKQYLETNQREMRRKRETGELEAFKPRWFTATTDPDSKAQFWKPLESDKEMSYWVERQKVGEKHQNGDSSAQWPGCVPIFGKYSK
ncbi:hypothetical protein MYAM1_003514 [Malassezia yamatoensis]|uniref:PH domain-containing protein n=1 Tax=Malassezia yamatoensis TaxID=253288 RepID=A0AAJ5YXY8_9BASI|nr:hypothetical protein MYAM1_003514 [Malassezia yamatoensis]